MEGQTTLDKIKHFYETKYKTLVVIPVILFIIAVAVIGYQYSTTRDFIKALSKRESSLPPWYGQAKKQIGKQEELTVIDGKEHKKVSDPKMGPEERAVFKVLLKQIERRNQWWYKTWTKAFNRIAIAALHARSVLPI